MWHLIVDSVEWLNSACAAIVQVHTSAYIHMYNI